VRAWLSERIALSAAASPETIPLLQTLLLGQRSELDETTLARFARTGIVHVFAISGLHMGLLAGMLFFCCRMVRVPYRFVGFVILPLLMLFALCTGMRASALRACIMIACMLLAPVVYRRPQLKNGFALALVLILGIAPGQVLDLGFQYSFLLVAALLAFGRPLGETFSSLTAPDPWAPETPRMRWWRELVAPRLEGALMVTVICFVISAPLTAYTFNLISPIGLVGNLLAIPLVFWILATGFPAVGVLFLPVEVSTVVLLPARFGAACLIDWVNRLESIPMGYSWVRSPELWQLWLFYGCLAMWWRYSSLKRVSQALLLVLAGYVAMDAWLFANRTEVVMLDADRGQMAWLRAGRKGIVMVDTGSDWSGWEGGRALKQRGVNRVDTLIFTHPDRYHVEGVRHILETHIPKRIRVSTPDRDHDLFQELKPSPSGIHRGDLFETAGWTVEVLYPEEDTSFGRADDRSLVLRFSRGFHSVLIMGGGGEAVEHQVAEQLEPIASRLILAGHPRSGELLTPPFLDRVQPEQVLFSGEGFGGRTPGRDSAESRMVAREIRIFRARPSVTFVLDLN
jgi:competence protein ComEC|nr:ComEC/Rec2 family competence protein [Kiritimatiellia bacterium]